MSEIVKLRGINGDGRPLGVRKPLNLRDAILYLTTNEAGVSNRRGSALGTADSYPKSLTVTEPKRLLKRIWGYDDFRGKQEAVIDHVLSGRDALVLFPTGKGKSVCFQIPALCLPGITVVVSPLVALMRDQVEELKALGVAADCLWSEQAPDEARHVRDQARSGRLKILYVTPERITSPGFLDMLGGIEVSLAVVDECHCISSWGHSFRKDYLELSRLKDIFPGTPRIALTATADPHTRLDIVRQLRMEDAEVFIDSFDRPNISYEIAERGNAKEQLLAFIRRHDGESGIVYCLSRKKVEETAAWLNESGVRAKYYHARLDPALKSSTQDAFRLEEGLCLVATVAFGMGINKPNVRYVAHLDLPSSVEGYYQETGRAGRDGMPSNAFMTYGMQDIVQRQRMIDEGDSTDEIKRIERAKLNALLAICETAGCRRQALLRHFGQQYEGRCGNCDTCIDPVESWDGTEAAIVALASVYRTGERFGTGHLVDVLLGRVNDKTKRFGHTDLPIFGAGKDRSPSEWQSIFRQLLVGDFVSVDHDNFGVLKLKEAARGVFKKETRVTLRKDRRKVRGKVAASTSKGSPRTSQMSERDRALFEALRARRMELSRALGVAPYVVFPDTTLIAFATERPATPNEMLGVSGVGQTKLERYGDEFLTVIKRMP